MKVIIGKLSNKEIKEEWERLQRKPQPKPQPRWKYYLAFFLLGVFSVLLGMEINDYIDYRLTQEWSDGFKIGYNLGKP